MSSATGRRRGAASPLRTRPGVPVGLVANRFPIQGLEVRKFVAAVQRHGLDVVDFPARRGLPAVLIALNDLFPHASLRFFFSSSPAVLGAVCQTASTSAGEKLPPDLFVLRALAIASLPVTMPEKDHRRRCRQSPKGICRDKLVQVQEDPKSSRRPKVLAHACSKGAMGFNAVGTVLGKYWTPISVECHVVVELWLALAVLAGDHQ
ncbi:hypothetical protein GPROT1_03509 [Gammaproteobacteria bacterium]|nr:hypothetical protein GPROT1_03509 [Gammaproteobacteria bacterium]